MVKVQLTVEVKGTMSGVVEVPDDHLAYDLLVAADEQFVTLTSQNIEADSVVSAEVIDDVAV